AFLFVGFLTYGSQLLHRCDAPVSRLRAVSMAIRTQMDNQSVFCGLWPVGNSTKDVMDFQRP
ncbi:hypothetical protein, partial [Faecalibaculum rodentium]|uniref:hypothetical protein n=1 Tax=Faecalibaculum rodentium TaxID=1702221 RepID=UPI003F4CB5F4